MPCPNPEASMTPTLSNGPPSVERSIAKMEGRHCVSVVVSVQVATIWPLSFRASCGAVGVANDGGTPKPVPLQGVAVVISNDHTRIGTGWRCRSGLVAVTSAADAVGIEGNGNRGSCSCRARRTETGTDPVVSFESLILTGVGRTALVVQGVDVNTSPVPVSGHSNDSRATCG